MYIIQMSFVTVHLSSLKPTGFDYVTPLTSCSHSASQVRLYTHSLRENLLLFVI